MTLHKNHKGLIHTTSYEQLNFIKENISQANKRRLLVTDPEIQRDEIIAEQVCCTIHLFLRTLFIRLHLHSNKHVIQ